MSRYFTLEEAESLIPGLDRKIRDAQDVRDELQKAEIQLQERKRQVALAGGTMVNVHQAYALRDRRDNAIRRLKSIIQEITEPGCQLKDLDKGLMDFPTLYEGGEVLMCWMLGEERISSWHGIEEGFAGRRPIDDHFRENHRGGIIE